MSGLHVKGEERECCVFWPSKEQPLRCEGFTVSYSREEFIHVGNDERVLVQDFSVESSQVSLTHMGLLATSGLSCGEASRFLPRMTTSWTSGSTAPSVGPTQTAPSETAFIWSAWSGSTADPRKDPY